MSRAPVVLWFRRDLRLADNEALQQAVATGRPLVCVYVLDDEPPGPWRTGGASRWWLHHSLESLDRQLRAHGGRLVLRRGEPIAALGGLIEDTDAATLCFTRCYEPRARSLEARLHDRLGDHVEVRRCGGNLLFEPEAVRTLAGRPFKVFTPFWKACMGQPEPEAPEPPPSSISFFEPLPGSDDLGDWGLVPAGPDWSAGLAEAWMPGEPGACQRLDEFLPIADRYKRDRDRPDLAGTSRLSPHLHFGEIGPRQIWHTARNAEPFLRQLIWREFSHYLLFHWPDLPEQPLRTEFVDFPWDTDPDALRAWQQGRTGYPMVDAGMRQLWATGWMHNRVRMITASFLVKHLLIPWQQGEAWFRDTLVDADLANNAAGWQWVAGCGTDAAPYFRIFNPVIQGRKFDPDGDYVRRWVPELGKLPAKYLHEPWAAPASALAGGGVLLGETYPEPIVDHAAARQRALDAYRQTKRS